MKKIFLANTIKEFEEFVNRTDIEVISVDVKVVEQTYNFQDSFAGVVYYNKRMEPCDCDGQEYHEKQAGCPGFPKKQIIELLPTPATGFSQETLEEIEREMDEEIKKENEKGGVYNRSPHLIRSFEFIKRLIQSKKENI